MANAQNPVNLGTYQLFHRDGSSDEGPLLELRRIGGSQADSDNLGVIRFYGEDDGDAEQIYAAIRARAVDVTDATEDGALDLRVAVAGTLTTMATVDSNGITFPDSAGFFGLNATQQFGADADITYSRATHGDLMSFFYGASITLSQQRNLTFPYDEGVTGGLAIVRVKEDASYPVNVRLEDPDNPGTYSEILVENSTRILRKSLTGSWWTDMGNFAHNGNKVALRGEAQFVIETHEDDEPRLIMIRNDGGLNEQNWHAFRIDSNGSLIVRDNTQSADRLSINSAGTLALFNYDSSNAEGPYLELRREGGSQADSDNLGVIRFNGQDDAGTPNVHTYAAIRGRVRDSSDGSEDGALDLRVSSAGTMTTIAALNETGVDFQGLALKSFLHNVVTSVSGTLTEATHSGNVLVTSGNVTVPTTTGFNCTLIFGGAHTITFNSLTSAAMASGDVVQVEVQSGTVIKAIKTAAADLVTFS